MAARHERLLSVAGALYDAAGDDAAWAGLAAKVAGIFGAPSASFVLKGAPGEARVLDATANLELRGQREREEADYWRSRDPWTQRAAAAGQGRIFLAHELMSRSELLGSSFYNDWCRKLGLFHQVGAVLPAGEGVVATLGIHRPETAAEFGEEDRQLAQLLLPHFGRALQLRSRLRRTAIEHSAHAQALRGAQLAVLAVAADMRLLHCCAEGERILRRGDALYLAGGRVRARGDTRAQELAAAVRVAVRIAEGPIEPAAAGRPPRESMALPRPGDTPVTLSVSPLRPEAGGTRMPAALIFIRELDRRPPEATVLQDVFRLTPAEASVCALLARGDSVQEAAAALGIGLNTIRTHIQRALAKTGTTRQAEMVAVVLRSVAALHFPGPGPRA